MRVSIRGTGLVSSYGLGVAAAVAGLRAGRPGITPLTLFPLPFANEVKVNQFDHGLFPAGEGGAEAIMLAAAREAFATLPDGAPIPDDCALVVGANGFLFAAEAEYRRRLEKTAHPEMPAVRAPGAVTASLAGALGMTGPVLTLSTACSSSANALLVAADLIARGEVRHALVVGAEGLSSVTLGGFHSLMLLDPQGCRPFDAQRRGMQLGEAAAAVWLAADEDGTAGASLRGGRSRHPASRDTGASLRGGRSRHPASRDTGASLRGGANLCDIHHVTSASPEGSAMRTVMAMALANAGLGPGDVTAIKAHGTGSLDNDTAEAAAMRGLFADHLPPFTGLKRYLGHTLGACGAVELVALLGCLRAGFLPATAGYTHTDPKLGVAPLTQPIAAGAGHYMLNFFGFGGNYASLILSHA